MHFAKNENVALRSDFSEGARDIGRQRIRPQRLRDGLRMRSDTSQNDNGKKKLKCA
jgi:hypothetical protein